MRSNGLLLGSEVSEPFMRLDCGFGATFDLLREFFRPKLVKGARVNDLSWGTRDAQPAEQSGAGEVIEEGIECNAVECGALHFNLASHPGTGTQMRLPSLSLEAEYTIFDLCRFA